MAIKGKPSAKFLSGEYKPVFVFCFKMEEMLDRKVHVSGDKHLYEIEKMVARKNGILDCI